MSTDIRVDEQEIHENLLKWTENKDFLNLALYKQMGISFDVELFINEIKYGTPLYRAAMDDDEEMVRFLVEQGAGVDYAKADHDYPARPALIDMIEFGRISMAKLLVDLGANMNHPLYTREMILSTLLDLCDLDTFSHEFLGWVLEAGWQQHINTYTTHGTTLLIEAVCTQNVEAIKLLLRYGADPNIRDCPDNNAPKMDPELAKLFPQFSKGLTSMYEQQQPLNAIDYAILTGNEEIIILLRKDISNHV